MFKSFRDARAHAAQRCIKAPRKKCAAAVAPRRSDRSPLARAPGAGGVGWRRVGLDAPDDAAVFESSGDDLRLETVDFFRAFWSDPFVFGEIAANHALNDIYAMGGTPAHALAPPSFPRPSAIGGGGIVSASGRRPAAFDREAVSNLPAAIPVKEPNSPPVFRYRRRRQAGAISVARRLARWRCADPDQASRHRPAVCR